MRITAKQWAAVGVVVATALIAWLFSRPQITVPSSSATSTALSAARESTTTPVAPATPAGALSTIKPFPIDPADKISSWTFTGDAAGNAALIEKSRADSARLANMLGSGTYDDYDLYVGMGNDAELIGDGRTAYRYYNRATAIHPNKGLAYANLAHLFDELGAAHTALAGYAKTVAVEPGTLEYHLERLRYLKDHFGSDDTLMFAALSDAEKQFGDIAEVLAIKAEWLTDERNYTDAIQAWQQAKLLSPGRDTSAIDAEIARLQAKL
ncbi:hypothetical protein KGM48_03580 [Patescibacteria group bacterium]|nr:hypothetical protein [Patescibacteria group bacterium]